MEQQPSTTKASMGASGNGGDRARPARAVPERVRAIMTRGWSRTRPSRAPPAKRPRAPADRTPALTKRLALGLNPPSLLSIYAFPPYLHNGACLTLECVLENETHRDAGGATGVLNNPEYRAAIVQFLISIDAQTEPINP